MSAFTDPVPLDPSDPNYMFLANNYLQELFFAARNIRFTNGAITNGAKVGNLDARWVVFTSNGSANTEDAVTHSLGRVPRLIIPCVPDKAANIYDSTTAHTDTTLYLKTSVATVAWKLIIA